MIRKLLLLIFLCGLLSGCSLLSAFNSSSSADLEPLPENPVREAMVVVDRLPSADGTSVLSSSYVVIDHSNSGKGYIMVEYVGTHTSKVKFRIVDDFGNTVTYDLHETVGFQTFPLTSGAGNYTLITYEQASGTEYYMVDTQTITATIEDEFTPFLYANQYVDFNEDTIAVHKAMELYEYTSTDIEFIERVFYYTQDSIKYDYNKAEAAVEGSLSEYLPVLDETINSGTGICFDYAAVMTAMLRSQNVPTKLVLGYVDDLYHAWINVYTEEKGWVSAIEFDGLEWKLMDPTFSDSGVIASFVGTGENYSDKYVY